MSNKTLAERPRQIVWMEPTVMSYMVFDMLQEGPKTTTEIVNRIHHDPQYRSRLTEKVNKLLGAYRQ